MEKKLETESSRTVLMLPDRLESSLPLFLCLILQVVFLSFKLVDSLLEVLERIQSRYFFRISRLRIMWHVIDHILSTETTVHGNLYYKLVY